MGKGLLHYLSQIGLMSRTNPHVNSTDRSHNGLWRVRQVVVFGDLADCLWLKRRVMPLAASAG